MAPIGITSGYTRMINLIVRHLFVTAHKCKQVFKEVKSLFADRMKPCIASHKFDSSDYCGSKRMY